MKKNIVLLVLFILPIVAYLFFASGVNSYTRLPIVTASVPDFKDWKSLDGQTFRLKGKITVLGFAGYDIDKNKGNLFNLNQKIYERYHEFDDLQFVFICPEGTQAEMAVINEKFAALTNMKDWHFVFATPQEILEFHKGLKLDATLSPALSTSKVYLFDKERNLRGRIDKSSKDYLEGYDTFHPSVLSNEMLDDFKILLYEYKAALKKNNNASKRKI